MSNNKLIQELYDLINDNIEKYSIPHVDKKSIRIKQYIIRQNKNKNWLVINAKKNKKIGTYFSKTSAIALAKTLSENQNNKTKIRELDNIIQKNNNDNIFYEHIIKRTKSKIKFQTAIIRSELSNDKIHRALEKLREFIIQ